MTASKPPRVYKGAGYWTTQIAFSSLMMLLGFGGGAFILFAPADVVSADGDPQRGAGVMLVLVGVVFLCTLVWLIRKFAGSSKEQRAVHAWIIMQMHARGVGDDLNNLDVAKRGRDGRLSRAEIAALQALRPDVPYPGKLPPE